MRTRLTLLSMVLLAALHASATCTQTTYIVNGGYGSYTDTTVPQSPATSASGHAYPIIIPVTSGWTISTVITHSGSLDPVILQYEWGYSSSGSVVPVSSSPIQQGGRMIGYTVPSTSNGHSVSYLLIGMNWWDYVQPGVYDTTSVNAIGSWSVEVDINCP
jgi:hypothetical protein